MEALDGWALPAHAWGGIPGELGSGGALDGTAISTRRARIRALMADLVKDLVRAADVDWVSTAATAYQESLEDLRSRVRGLEDLLGELDGDLLRLETVQGEVEQVRTHLSAVVQEAQASGGSWP